MVTKLIAAELATSAGCNMVITIGSAPKRIFEILKDIQDNEDYKRDPILGTHFVASHIPMDDRQWWISHSLAVSGTLVIDAGAARAISRKDKGSLFSAGIIKVQGSFNAQECVSIITTVDGKEIQVGKGLVNYSSLEIQRLLGVKSKDIADILGYMESEYIIHRDNLAITNSELKQRNSVSLTAESKSLSPNETEN
jgi:glutamate 5-kinase